MDNCNNGKPFCTYGEQIKTLTDKMLIVDNEEYAKLLLKKCGYYALISGYKKPFKQSDGNYKRGTSIEDIYALYCFDMELRHILLKNILLVENHLKSLISYSFCEEFGEDQQQYLISTNYNYSTPKMQNEINELISILQTITKEPHKHNYINYQLKKYGNIPLWAIMRVLTLGNVSKMYSMLKPTIQTKVSKEFLYVNEGMLANMLDLLSRFRNICAHNSRLFCYRYDKGSIQNTSVHRKLNVVKNKNGSYKYGKKDLFAVIISLKYLLSEGEFDLLVENISNQLTCLSQKTNQIQKDQMLAQMGLPTNWLKIKNIEKF